MECEASSAALEGTEMSEPMNVTAAAERSGGWWSVEVPEIPGLFTQTRRLDQIDAMVRNAAGMLDREIGTVTVEPKLPERDERMLAELLDARRRASEAQSCLLAHPRRSGRPTVPRNDRARHRRRHRRHPAARQRPRQRLSQGTERIIMTAIESLPAYRKAEAEAERRGENLSSLIDAFLAGYARGASTNSLAATPQPGDTVLRDETDWRMLRDEMHGEKL